MTPRITAYLVELAIQLPSLAAIMGAWLTLRRPGMGTLTWAWLCLSAASVVAAIGFGLQTDRPVVVSQALLIATFSLIVAGFLLLRESARKVAGVSAPASRVAGRVTAWSVGYVVLLVLLLDDQLFPLRTIIAGRLLMLAAAGAVVWTSLRARRRAEAAAAPLRLLALAGVLQMVRLIVRSVLDADSARATPYFGDAATVITAVALQAALAMAAIMAVLAIEQQAMRTQADAMASIERERAVGRRLESLGKMASAIAHDFNNVLTVIRHGVDTAREVGPSDAWEWQTALRDASEGTDRAQSLAARLLDFARARPTTPVALPVAERISATSDVWRRLVPRTVELQVQTDPAVPRVTMDPVEFDQVLLNLVTNAADAVDGKGTVRVACGRLDVATPLEGVSGTVTPGVYACLQVEDTGQGMSEDVLRSAFDPFFTTKGARGTGLGLATVLAIVRGAKGNVRVCTEPGRGTRFDVILPATN